MKDPFFAPESVTRGDITVRMYQIADTEDVLPVTLASYEHLRPWMPWASPELTRDQSEVVRRKQIANYPNNEDFSMGIWVEGIYAGGTGFHTRGASVQTGCAEIGMWIAASQAGKGIGTRVLEIMLEWGFNDWGWERLVWKCDTSNQASTRVAQKCGLNLEATLRSDSLDTEGNRRDTFQFAMLREEYCATIRTNQLVN